MSKSMAKYEGPSAWRKGRPVLPLATFDYPHAHKRYKFRADTIYGLTECRMSRWPVNMQPEDIRLALHKKTLNNMEVAYFGEVFNQMDGIDFKEFLYSCGSSIYELARTMNACPITSVYVKEFINYYSLVYDPNDQILPKYSFQRNL